MGHKCETSCTSHALRALAIGKLSCCVWHKVLGGIFASSFEKAIVLLPVTKSKVNLVAVRDKSGYATPIRRKYCFRQKESNQPHCPGYPVQALTGGTLGLHSLQPHAADWRLSMLSLQSLLLTPQSPQPQTGQASCANFQIGTNLFQTLFCATS